MENNQTICEFLNIKVEKGRPSFTITHSGNQIYYETSDGYWYRKKYDDKGNQIYYEDSDGYWWRSKYNSNDNQTYYEDSEGEWWRYEYDTDGNLTYCESSYGYIEDSRPKELTMDEIAEKFNISVTQLKIGKG